MCDPPATAFPVVGGTQLLSAPWGCRSQPDLPCLYPSVVSVLHTPHSSAGKAGWSHIISTALGLSLQLWLPASQCWDFGQGPSPGREAHSRSLRLGLQMVQCQVPVYLPGGPAPQSQDLVMMLSTLVLHPVLLGSPRCGPVAGLGVWSLCC